MTIVNGKVPYASTPVRPTLLRALIVGAGVAGRALARDLEAAPQFGLMPVGFVDDDPTKQEVTHYPVLGSLDRVAEIAIRENIDVVVMAIPALDPDIFRKVAQGAASAGASVRYLPSFVAALKRRVGGSDMRWLDVGQLIGRDEVHVVSSAAAEIIKDKVVLVTGAGGSIGSELCRQLARFEPSALLKLDRDESGLHAVQLSIVQQQPGEARKVGRERTACDEVAAGLAVEVAGEGVDLGLEDVGQDGQAAVHVAVEGGVAHRNLRLVACGQHERPELVGDRH